MKPSLSLAALLAALALFPALLRADDAQNRRTAADALLKAMHTEQMLENSLARGLQIGASLGQQDQAAVQKAQAEAMEIIRKQLNWESLKTDFVQIYADTFTEAELKQLTAFYQSPVGQKFVDKQGDMATKISAVTMPRMTAIMPALRQQIRDSLQKNAPPAAPVASPSPAAPSASAGLVPPTPTPAASAAPKAP